MDRGHRARGALVLSLVLIVGACASSKPTPTPPSANSSTGPTLSPASSMRGDGTQSLAPEPVATAAPDPGATPAPAATPTASPKPPQTPAAATNWTKPIRVGTAKWCQSLSAGIDVAGRYHVAAGCDGSIRYYVSDGGRTWTTTRFSHPANRMELEPQIAFRGNVVYVAYSRIVPAGDCGGDGAEVGVYFRTRNQPGGAWSSAARIGSLGDRLQAFRVDGETIHTTVLNDRDGGRYYGTLEGSTYHRYRIPNAIGGTALRIGSDGRARIAYETAGGLWFAVFTGSGFSRARIPGTKEDDWGPQLVLDSADTPHVGWNRWPAPGSGCAVRDRNADDGVYYATNTGGAWAVRRITKETQEASLQVDPTTGRPEVIQGGRFGLYFFTRSSNGRWVRSTAVRKRWPGSPVLRLDPATGTLLAVYSDLLDDESSRIYAVTKPHG